MFKFIWDMKIKTKLWGVFLIFLSGVIVLFLLGYKTFNFVKISGPLYKNIRSGKDIVTDVLPSSKYITEAYLICNRVFFEKYPENLSAIKELFRELQLSKDEYYARQEAWLKELTQGELKSELVKLSQNTAERFYKIADEEFIPLALAGELDQARKVLDDTLSPLYKEYRKRADEVIKLDSEANKNYEEYARRLIYQRLKLMSMLGILLLGFSVILITRFIRTITSPLVKLGEAVKRISEGDFSEQGLISNANDETGVLTKAVEEMRVALKSILGGLKDEIDWVKKTEDELRDARDSLENKVQERTAELEETRNKMFQSGKLAAVGQLASSVAHEINNPLTGVLNNVQLIKMEMDMGAAFKIEDFRAQLDVIEESAARCVKIARSLLDFSRAAKGVFQPFSLNEAIEKTITLIGHELKLRDVLVKKKLGENLPQIQGDAQLIQQVIFDIVNNARYAIEKKPEKKGGWITLETGYDTAKDLVLLSVSDDGTGISQENLEKLFTPFFTTKPAGEGTGLGLSFIQDIVQRHNGKVSVESELGKGTTFHISFPAIK